ncbi:MAG: lysophospholipid acyltransferase family protein [Helicobacteraceae bacterium]|nr:lysophospholipid acyltransferase family protein [Helicobacteraceae bacterium]
MQIHPLAYFNRIKMALYATFLTNVYGLKLKKARSGAEKKKLRLEYAQKLLSALNISVVVKGGEKLPKDGRFLLITNHRSIIDPLIIEAAFKDTDIFGLWVSKKELYNSFFFGVFTRNGGTVLLDRETKQMSGFFKEIKAGIDEGNSIFLFPEGTRNKGTSDLSEFKEGARIIAVKNRLPILPIYIRTNANETLEAGLKKRPQQQQQVIVEIGDLIDYKERSVDLETAYRKMFHLKY